MPGALQIGRLFGIGIRVHFSWIFIFALVAWSLATAFLPANYPGWSSRTYWSVGVIGSSLLFASVLAHELSHSLVAIARGRKVQGITLFFLGGMSEIEEESRDASEEFWIAVVGPLTSLALALIFWVLFVATSWAGPQIRAVAHYLALINALLGVFNLLPAFPMDGGRVLKALVWRASGSESRANSVASLTGYAMGYALIGIGVFLAFFTSDFMLGLWLVFIGWFIQSSASTFRRQKALDSALSGKTVRDAMQDGFPVVTPGTSVQQLVDGYITREFQRAYVVALGDTFYGLVTVSDVAAVPAGERGSRWVTSIMTKAPDVVSTTLDEPLEQAMEKLINSELHQLLVMDEGRPVGMLTRGDVLRVLEVSQLMSGGSARK